MLIVGYHQLFSDAENYISNLDELPAQLSIQFTPTSGYRNITWGQPVNYTYPTYGEKEICVRATYSNGKVLESHVHIQVVPIPPAYSGEEDRTDETINLSGNREHS